MIVIPLTIKHFMLSIVFRLIGGWKKRSVVATIVCSLIIVCLLANWIAIFPNNILWVILGMSMILIIIAGFVGHNPENIS